MRERGCLYLFSDIHKYDYVSFFLRWEEIIINVKKNLLKQYKITELWKAFWKFCLSSSSEMKTRFYFESKSKIDTVKVTNWSITASSKAKGFSQSQKIIVQSEGYRLQGNFCSRLNKKNKKIRNKKIKKQK